MLKKGCPLPVSIIAKKRAQYLRQVNILFAVWELSIQERRAIATERTILYMDKFRNQDRLEDHL